MNHKLRFHLLFSFNFYLKIIRGYLLPSSYKLRSLKSLEKLAPRCCVCCVTQGCRIAVVPERRLHKRRGFVDAKNRNRYVKFSCSWNSKFEQRKKKKITRERRKMATVKRRNIYRGTVHSGKDLPKLVIAYLLFVLL